MGVWNWKVPDIVFVVVSKDKILISNLIKAGVRMINSEATIGAGGHRIAFVHPESTGGVLVELVERIN